MDVLMPQLGETVAEGKITKWFKAAGDAVKPGDPLFEIETDKTSMEVEATGGGVLAEVRVAEGEVAPVGAIVAVISDGRARSTATSPRPSPPAPKANSTLRAPVAISSAGTCRAQRRDHPTGSFFRGPHAAAQLRPRQAGRRRDRHAAGAASRERIRHRSRPHPRIRTAGPHFRARPDAGAARRFRCAHARPHGRADQGAVRAGQLRGAAARQHARDHRHAPGAGQADHPALLSDCRH